MSFQSKVDDYARSCKQDYMDDSEFTAAPLTTFLCGDPPFEEGGSLGGVRNDLIRVAVVFVHRVGYSNKLG